MAKGQHFTTIADEVQFLRSVVALQVKFLDRAYSDLTVLKIRAGRVLKANDEFVDGLPDRDWDGDPLQDACAVLSKALAASPAPVQKGTEEAVACGNCHGRGYLEDTDDGVRVSGVYACDECRGEGTISPPASEPAPVKRGETIPDAVMRLMREDFDPTPPGFEGRGWDDNAEDVADKIVAAVLAGSEARS